MKTIVRIALGIGACVLAASTAWADVHITMANGRVTLIAKDATIRQIMTEWARVGQAKIVNVERITGAPVTLEFHDLPEAQALDVLLRTVAGYFAVPRSVTAAGGPNLSVFDRVVVMPGQATPRAPVSASAAPPVFPQQPQFNRPEPADDDGDDQRGAPTANPNVPRGPVFNTFPPQQPPQVVNPQMPNGQPGAVGGVQQPAPAQAPAPSAFPTAPAGGVAVPGMVAPPPPQQPGQIAQPGRQGGPGVRQQQ
jgi:hypothetical protein